MNPMFSVVIPCYNEEANLDRLFIKVLSLLTEYPKSEVVLVNNGSTDQSLTKLNTFKLEHKYKSIVICNVKENKGYGFGILEGLKLAKGDVLSWTHADLQTDLLDVGKAFDLYRNKITDPNPFLLVKGFRINRKVTESLLSFGMAAIASAQLKTWMQEVNAQPKMFTRIFYDTAKENAPFDFSLDLHWMYIAKKKGTIETFPVQFLPRIAGDAKGGSGSNFATKWKIIKRTLAYINELDKQL